MPFSSETQLLSTGNLVILCLSGIPQAGYISPEVMVACSAPMTRLTYLYIKFQPNSLSDQLDPAPTETWTFLRLWHHSSVDFQDSQIFEFILEFIDRSEDPQPTCST